MTMQPLISVIMPVYDGAFTLDRAIRSVVAQQFADWEIVAVDDGSADDTWEILQRWAPADCRIRISRFEENRGVAAAWTEAQLADQGLLDAARKGVFTSEQYEKFLAPFSDMPRFK